MFSGGGEVVPTREKRVLHVGRPTAGSRHDVQDLGASRRVDDGKSSVFVLNLKMSAQDCFPPVCVLHEIVDGLQTYRFPAEPFPRLGEHDTPKTYFIHEVRAIVVQVARDAQNRRAIIS